MDVAVIGTTGQSITFTLPPFRFKGFKRTEKKKTEKKPTWLLTLEENFPLQYFQISCDVIIFYTAHVKAFLLM